MKKTSLNRILLKLSISMVAACTNTESTSPDQSTQSDKPSTVQSTNKTEPSPNPVSQQTETHSSENTVTRSADSHTHGDASLAVVLEGSKVTVELDTPLYNLVGFEHGAETEAQKAAVIKAESVLSDAATLFVFNSEASCAAADTTRSIEIDVEHGHEDHGEDDHGDHDKDHDEHDDEHHDDDDHDADEETHKDVTVQYNYMCDNPDALKNVTVTLFEHFENLTELDLVYLGPNTQKQGELSAAKPRMDLTR